MAEIFTFENLHGSYMKTRQGKRYTQSALEFENNYLTNIVGMVDELSKEDYQLSPYNEFKVYVPKTRIITAPTFRDRVMQRCLCDYVLSEAIEKHFIYDTYACRVGKGTHAGLDRFEEFMRSYYRKWGTDGWVLKADIRQYFYSIVHEILKQNMYPLLEGYDITWLLDPIIDSTKCPGIPLGNQSSQWFANFYLSGFDHFVKEKLQVKMYVRYMDDFCMIFRTKDEAKECLDIIRRYLMENLQLELNHKTQIFPLSQGVDFLGYHMYLTDTGRVVKKLRQDSKRRVKKKLKSLKFKYARGTATKEDIRRSYSSWRGHASHGNCHQLIKKMDGEYENILKGA